MAEVQSRSTTTRGRGSGRGGRGGYSSRGGRQTSSQQKTNGDLPTALPMVPLDEQGEMGQLKLRYASELDTLREMFPDWSDDDLALAVQDNNGDLTSTAEKITEGNVSQFSAVTKKSKEKSKTKKDASAVADSTASTRGRGRGGHESSRGTRGRGTERGGRGRGTARGGSTSAPRTTTTQVPVASTDTNEWDAAATTTANTDETSWADTPADNSWDQPSAAQPDTNWASSTSEAIQATPEAAKSSLIPEGSTKSWASMFAKKDPVLAAQQGGAGPAADQPFEDTAPPYHPPAEPDVPGAFTEGDQVQVHTAQDGLPSLQFSGDALDTPPASSVAATGSTADLTPPRNQLTEDNLERIPDVSQPPPTDTIASTRDPGSAVGGSTPLGDAGQNLTPTRPPMGGYATTAWKATGAPGRSVSYQRKMMEQREAVVMPGNHAVDRTTVQFGSMGLGGDNSPLDVDDDREEAQTRAPVAQSPPSQPRTALPPAPLQQSIAPDAAIQDSLPTPKQAPGYPSNPQQPHTSLAPGMLGQGAGPQQSAPSSQAYGQYGRYGAGPVGQETSAKPYDPFSQQTSYPQSLGESQSSYPAPSQAPGLQQGQNQQGGYDYNSHYGEQQHRSTSGGYYGSGYGQQHNAASHQEQGLGQQRTGSAFANTDSGYGTNHHSGAQSRFSENQASGHTTPNPTMASQHQMGSQPQQVHHAQGHHGQGQGGHASGYGGYQQPYYNNSYYNSYMNQGYPNNYYNQQGYGQPYGGKGGNMYNQQQQGYGMSGQSSYEHSSSPANQNSYAANMRGTENSLSGGLGEYGGRSSSTQPSHQNNSATGGYSNEGYGRNVSGGYGQSQYGQQDESLKPYQEQKSGPSPSLGQPGRTGSAANSGYGGGNQSGLPAPGSQQGFGGGGYPSHHNQQHNTHGSGYGSNMGGLGSQQSAQSHQAGGYGGYGGFGNSYSGYGRGGWGGNSYGQQQQH